MIPSRPAASDRRGEISSQFAESAGIWLGGATTPELRAATVAALLAHAASVQGQTIICASHDPAIITEADAVLVLDR